MRDIEVIMIMIGEKVDGNMVYRNLGIKSSWVLFEK